MQLHGTDYLRSLLDRPAFEAKCLVNDEAAAFFPATLQHRDTSFPTLNYRDDHTGTGIAGMVYPGRVELRFHRAFADARVVALWLRLLREPALHPLATFTLTYQGRTLSVPAVDFKTRSPTTTNGRSHPASSNQGGVG